MPLRHATNTLTLNTLNTNIQGPSPGGHLNVFSAVNKAPLAPASWHINMCDWSQKAGAGEHLWVFMKFILFLILDPSATFCFL